MLARAARGMAGSARQPACAFEQALRSSRGDTQLVGRQQVTLNLYHSIFVMRLVCVHCRPQGLWPACDGLARSDSPVRTPEQAGIHLAIPSFVRTAEQMRALLMKLWAHRM